jgi:hypothetical protein
MCLSLALPAGWSVEDIGCGPDLTDNADVSFVIGIT